MMKRLIIWLFAIVCSFGAAYSQERINGFKVVVDESHNPMTIYSSYGATPNDGVVIINSTIPDLEFGIMSVAKERLRKVVPDKGKNRYILIVQPNDNNYKRYTITINAKGFMQGRIENVVVKAGLSTGYIVNSTFSEIGKNHEYVDLGLPSGTLWATCNVGANTPKEYGFHFAWGETMSKTRFDYNYKHFGSSGYLTKYTTNYDQLPRDTTDGLVTLEACDDAATAYWGTKWRTPTKDQWAELMKYCRWISISGGYKVVGSNGNYIFLPAAGMGFLDDRIQYTEVGGSYWSASLYIESSLYAWAICFDPDKNELFHAVRYCGMSVRPVYSIRK